MLSVFTREWLDVDVAIADGWIAGLGDYEGARGRRRGRPLRRARASSTRTCTSSRSKLLPDEFARLVLPLGTTAVVADPHEIANVLGTDGVHWLLDALRRPAARRLLHGLVVRARRRSSSRRAARSSPGDLEGLLRRRRVLGLAEMMNFPGVISGDAAELAKLALPGAPTSTATRRACSARR